MIHKRHIHGGSFSLLVTVDCTVRYGTESKRVDHTNTHCTLRDKRQSINQSITPGLSFTLLLACTIHVNEAVVFGSSMRQGFVAPISCHHHYFLRRSRNASKQPGDGHTMSLKFLKFGGRPATRFIRQTNYVRTQAEVWTSIHRSELRNPRLTLETHSTTPPLPSLTKGTECRLG